MALKVISPLGTNAELDVAVLEVQLYAPPHKASSLGFWVELSVKDAWQYDDESDIDPPVVVLARPADTRVMLDGHKRFERRCLITLQQSLLDAMKSIVCTSLWSDETHLDLTVQYYLMNGDETTHNESISLSISNPLL